ncbi:hypothetical protein [Dactylosporangium sp. NPDC048998]|uniref:hypothetical protein n=1 Tax=Dactylosporangium sp. NPDC048998 TaxID=3363976 RepID=UPI00371D8413
MSTDEATTPAVDLSAVASHRTEPLHADTADFAGATDFGAIDDEMEDELAEDAQDAPFDLDADIAHPHPGHAGPGFDLARDVSL